MTCIFCDIVEKKRTSFVVYEDEYHLAFLDKYPVDTGHCLVIPKKHSEKITDMQKDAVGNLFSIVPQIADAILSATGADSFSIAQNNGRSAKQIIPHVHIHIIPRYKETGTVWTKRKIATDEELTELQNKIKQLLS